MICSSGMGVAFFCCDYHGDNMRIIVDLKWVKKNLWHLVISDACGNPVLVYADVVTNKWYTKLYNDDTFHGKYVVILYPDGDILPSSFNSIKACKEWAETMISEGIYG